MEFFFLINDLKKKKNNFKFREKDFFLWFAIFMHIFLIRILLFQIKTLFVKLKVFYAFFLG